MDVAFNSVRVDENMRPEDIREVLEHKPFQPFRLVTVSLLHIMQVEPSEMQGTA